MLYFNKSDLPRRVVSCEEGSALAREHCLISQETSSETAHDVEQAFVQTAKTIYENTKNSVYDLSCKSSGMKVG